jgi:hypothetical protein
MFTAAAWVARHAPREARFVRTMTAIPRYRSHVGPVILSAGFRPFFLGASIWAAVAIPLWLGAYAEGLALPTKLAPLGCKRASRWQELAQPADARRADAAAGRYSAAFAALMRSNNQRLYRLARGFLRDDLEAEEAVHDGYVSAFTHLDGFRGGSRASLPGWRGSFLTKRSGC